VRAGHRHVNDLCGSNRGKTLPDVTGQAEQFAEPSECEDLVAQSRSARAGFMWRRNTVNDGRVCEELL